MNTARSGQRVRDLLEGLGLDQKRAAAALDVSPRTMRRYCSGEAAFPLAVDYALRYLKACKASGTDPCHE